MSLKTSKITLVQKLTSLSSSKPEKKKIKRCEEEGQSNKEIKSAQ